MAKSKKNQRAAAPAKPRPNTPPPVQPAPVQQPSAPAPAASRTYSLPPVLLTSLTVLAGLAALIPVGIHANLIAANAVNMPFQDDFNCLEFIYKYIEPGASLDKKLQLLTAQHNEHRIVLDRLAFLTDYFLTGGLNFRHMILFGNVSLLLLLGLLFLASFERLPLVQRVIFFVPVSFCLFQLHYWELCIWGMASIQNLYVLVFALLSLYALTRPVSQPYWFWIACLSAVAATYTSGNGLFTFGAGVVGLLYFRQYRRLAVWLGVGIVAIGLYFWGYTRPGNHPPIVSEFLAKPGQFFDHFFTLTGSIITASPLVAGRWMLAVAVGVAAFYGWRRHQLTNPTMAMMLVFMYLTCLSVSAGRAGFGVNQALDTRYGIQSVMLLLTLYVLLLNAITRPMVRAVVFVACLVGAIALYTTSYQANAPKLTGRGVEFRYDVALYRDNPANLLILWDNQEMAKNVFRKALDKKVYQVPAITLERLKSQPTPTSSTGMTATNDITSDIKPYLTHDYIVFYQNWAVLNGVSADRLKTSVIATSANGSYAFDTSDRLIRYDVANQLQSAQFLRAGFCGVIKKTDLKPGHYTLWLHLANEQTHGYQPLNVSFDV